METKDIRILRILEKAQDGKPPGLRDLARELNISMGLLKSFIKLHDNFLAKIRSEGVDPRKIVFMT